MTTVGWGAASAWTLLAVYAAGAWVSAFWSGYRRGCLVTDEVDGFELTCIALWPLVLSIWFAALALEVLDSAFHSWSGTKAGRALNDVLWFALLPLRPLTAGRLLYRWRFRERLTRKTDGGNRQEGEAVT